MTAKSETQRLIGACICNPVDLVPHGHLKNCPIYEEPPKEGILESGAVGSRVPGGNRP